MLKTLIYITDGFWREIGDQRVHSNYPLMSGGPIPIIAIVSLYVYFVRFAGPAWMQTRKPYDLKWSIRLYNILMSLINLYIFYRVSVLTRYGLNYFGCKQVGYDQAGNELVDLAFLYFATKLVELLDTVFFILRKKYNQASNLHVFHHGFIAVCVWIYFKVAPGGSSVLFPYLNVGVHSVMYSYYFLATFPSLQRHLWWKRHLTSTQIIQFVMSMVHFSFQGLSSCEYPPALAIIGFVFNFVFFVLFCDFYYHAYLRSSSRSANTKKLDNDSKVNSDTIIDDNNNSKSHSTRQKVVNEQSLANSMDNIHNVDLNNNNNNNNEENSIEDKCGSVYMRNISRRHNTRLVPAS